MYSVNRIYSLFIMGIIFSDLPFTELSEYARIDCLICRKSWINNSIGAQIIGYTQEREPPPKAQYYYWLHWFFYLIFVKKNFYLFSLSVFDFFCLYMNLMSLLIACSRLRQFLIRAGRTYTDIRNGPDQILL